MFSALIAAATLSGPCSEAAQSRLADALPLMLAEAGAPGAAVACIEDGVTRWTVSAGERRGGEPALRDTIWNVASLTKPVTAQIVLELASDGVIDLDAPMSQHYADPDLADTPELEILSVRHALQHQTGFPNWRGAGGLAFDFAPGEATSYSGEGYTYAARYAEAVTGEAFPDLANAVVFDPLGLDAASYERSAALEDRIADGHTEAGAPAPEPPEGWSGADNLYVTLADYAAFVGHVIEGEGLAPALRAQRFKIAENQIGGGCPLPEALCPSAVGFGLGWEIFEFGETRIVQHGGADTGERALAFFDEATGDGAVVLTNSANGGQVIARVAELLFPELEDYTAVLRLQADMEPAE